MKSSHLRRPAATLAALALCAPLLTGCGGSGSAASGEVQAVASFYPLAWVTEQVAGDDADVTNLTQPGAEPHDLELSVKQTARLSEADVVVYEKGFQSAVDDAVEQADPEHAADAAAVARLRGDDPHFWLDPTRLSAVAGQVEKQLSAADESHAKDYAANLRALRTRLAALDRDLRTGLADCRRDTIVVSHDAFGYLGARYGLDVVGINGLSPDAEPSPAHLRQLADLVKDKGITTVFSEELASPKLADSLADEVGVRTAVLDPVEGLSKETADEDYLSLMQQNLQALRKANDCG